MTLWVARAGKYGERESFALENDLVVVGWPDMPDLSAITGREELLDLLNQIYPDHKQGTLKNWESQIWAFLKRFNEGDIVALPLKTRSAIAFGRIAGPYSYRPESKESPHRRPVEWLKTDVPRGAIDSDIRFSLGGAMTVFQVSRNNAEARVRAMLEGKSPPRVAREAEESDGEASEDDALIDLQEQARDQISEYISRKFRGHELSQLVAGVLRAQGYKIFVSPPGADGGVDIVAGRGPLGLERPRLCVQVKSGDERVDVVVLRELQGVMRNYNADQGLIVSWGGFKDTVYREARTLFFEIRLWDQSELVNAIQETYADLPDQIQAELPLQQSWLLVVESE